MPEGVEVSLFQVQLGVVRALAESATLKDALPRVIQAVCETSGWEWGAFWLVDPQTTTLRCAQVWHSPSTHIPEFEKLSREIEFPPGVGLPGRVWKSGAPAWVSDVVNDDNFPRRF